MRTNIRDNRDGESAVPLVIGVTGHRLLREEDRLTLTRAVKSELVRLKERYPNTPLLMLNSLAEGADLLCADAAKDLDIPLSAVLPMDRETYTKNYSEADRKKFSEHASRAASCFTAPDQEPGRAGEYPDRAYRQAGIYIVTHCHVLLALWDGKEAEKGGCGTPEMVRIALTGDYSAAEGVPARSGANTGVIHVTCPRKGGTGNAGEVRYLGDTDAVREILSKTDCFNRDAGKIRDQQTDPLFSGSASDDALLWKMAKIYAAADELSVRYAKRYRLTLALLAVFGTLLAASFLLYDEAELYRMIFVTGLALLCMAVCYRYAVRSDCHRKYLDYRVLAESLRAQAFLRYAGSPLEVFTILPLTQQEEIKWVLDALCAVTACEPPKGKRPVREEWAEKQRDYHARAKERAAAKKSGSDRVVQTAVILSAMLYIAALLFEILAGGVFPKAAISVQEPGFWRAVLKIALGAISAGTLFIANYYGKQSLARKESDHGKMERFYAKMSQRVASDGETEQLLKELAREELIENGNWYAYQSENAPDISL